MTSASNNQSEMLSIEQDITALKTNINQFFLIIMGSIVFFLQPGFSFYDSAMVRQKNIVSVCFRNYIDIVIGTFMYFLTGYALSFGGGNGFCGTKYFALIDLPEDQYALVFFQYTFAAAATTIPGGVVHERCTITAYFWYTLLLSGLIYPCATHWAVAPEGWLFRLGFDDFAFSGVFHALGGAASLAAAYMAGPRSDHFNRDGSIRRIPPHSIGQGVLGAFIFFFGILAFNAGSQLTISNPGDGSAVGKIILNTVICTVACCLTGLLHQRYIVERSEQGWDFASALNGSFVGMVVICTGCNRMRFWGALLAGIFSYFSFLIVRRLCSKLNVDDVVDSIPIHIGGGYAGLLSTPLFKEGGLLLAPSKASAYVLLINAIAGIVIMLWSAGVIILLYLILEKFGLHRASANEERIGLDLSVHGEEAYRFEKPDDGEDLSQDDFQSTEDGKPWLPPGLRQLVRRRIRPTSNTTITTVFPFTN